MVKITTFQDGETDVKSYIDEALPLTLAKRIATYKSTAAKHEGEELDILFLLPFEERETEISNIISEYGLSDTAATRASLRDMGTPENILRYFQGQWPAGLSRSEKNNRLASWQEFWTEKFSNYATHMHEVLSNLLPATDYGIILHEPEFEAPPPPAPRRIAGKVTHSILRIPIQMALITFEDKSAVSAPDGNYIIEDPAKMSAPITCSLPGYETITNMITAPVTGILLHNFSLTPIAPPPEPELTWWEKLLELAKPTSWFPYLIDKAIFLAAYKLFTGRTMTGDEYDAHAAEILDWILPINTIKVLMEGKNLKGETEEFGDTEHWFDLAATAFMFIPIARLPKFITKLGAKIGFKGIFGTAEKLALKKATPAQIEALIKSDNFKYVFEAMRRDPAAWYKLAPKFTKETQALRSAGLKKQHPLAASKLFEEAILKADRAKLPITDKTLNFMKAHIGKGVVGLVTTAFGIMGFDAWTNWPLIDNVGFLKYNEIQAVRNSFIAGTITKEEALVEMDKIIELLTDIVARVELSINWNPLMAIFGGGFLLTAKENLAMAIRVKEEIEAEIPPEPTGLLVITPIPSDSKVSVEGQIPTTGIFSEELPVGTYTYVISKFGYTSKSGTIELTEAGLEITVEIEKEVAPPEELVGELIISVEPSEANITISGHPEIKIEGTYTLPIGSYTVYFSLGGYKPATKYAEVKTGIPVTVSATLIKEEEPEPEKAELLITSKPSFADVMIDGKSTFQKTPYTAFLDEGIHKIRVELSGYEPEEEEIEVAWGDEKSIEIILNKTPPTKGTLRILSEPSGAQVYINGQSQFATTPFTITLEAETYKIRLTKEGYLPDEADITIEAGVEKEHNVNLTLKPITQATITLTSEPTEADIYIDGVYKFVKTPYTILLDPKDYIFRIQKDGYYPIEIIAEVEEGEVSEIPFILEAIPPPDIPPDPYVPYEPWIPDYVPPTPYIPPVIPTPPDEFIPYDYDLLYPDLVPTPDVGPISPPLEKELLINIETTDLMPTKGRIYSIAFLDLSDPLAETRISVMNDERELINSFIDFFETGLYTKLVGYNVSFDYRFIFTKMMKYRMASKAWKNVKLKDVMQIMKQVKEEFVFGFNKPGTLDAWGKMILGKGKYGSQELMLKKYIAGDFDYVMAFQNRQIELTRDLYALSRFVSSEGFISSPPTSPESTPAETLEAPEGFSTPTNPKVCPVCKAFNPTAATICEICGAAI